MEHYIKIYMHNQGILFFYFHEKYKILYRIVYGFVELFRFRGYRLNI